jgi:spore coat protein A
VLAALLVAWPGASAATTLTVTMSSSHDTTLYGGDDEVGFSDGAGASLFAGNNNQSEPRRALLAFDVTPAIPAGSTITSAVLRLVVTRTQLRDASIELHRVTASWGESTSRAGGNEGGGTPAAEGDATWSHRVWPTLRWTSAGGDFFASPSASAPAGDVGTTVEWQGPGVVDDVQRWFADPTTNFGWILVANPGDGAKRFGSHEGAAGARPQLVVTFTPPASPVGACCGARGACGYTLDPGSGCAGSYQGAGSVCDACPPPTAACCRPDVTAACAVETQAACAASGGVWSESAESCDGNPCPVVLTPFVDALPLPAVATPVATSPEGVDQYRMSIIETKQKLHRDLPPTTVWGFSDGQQPGGYPGPTIEAKVDQPIDVTWVNDLRDASGAPLAAHPLNVDTCPHGATPGPPRTVIHLHGGHVPSASDGQPDMTLAPGESATYHYPNHQRAATLWYHDHALGVTRLDVMMGLAGYYILRDDAEEALGLPSGKYDVPLVIQDRSFLPDGRIEYPEAWQESFFGNTILVNGKVWPYLDVTRAAYRFRILNGSTSRTYTLSLSPYLPMVQVAGDGGLLRSGIARPTVTIGPGERTEVVIDFGSPVAESSYTLMNEAPAPYPSGRDENAVANVMKFIVSPDPGPRNRLPVYLRRDQGALDPATATVTRDISLARSGDGCGGGTWMINGLGFHDDITERPHLGTTEIWRFLNRSGTSHTMHLHLAMFEVLDRQRFTLDGDDVVLTGTASPPDPGEQGWKDTVLVGPFEVVRVVTRFEDYLGRFPYHCHMLEHEDHNMMRQLETQPPCPDGGCPDIDGGACAGDAARCEAGSGGGCSCDLGRGAPSGGGALLVLALAAASARRGRAGGRRFGGARRACLVLGPLLVAVTSGSCGTSPASPQPPIDPSADAAADASAAEVAVPADDAGQAPSSGGDASDTPGPAAKLPFGATCDADGDCDTGVCFAFGDGTKHCSLACTDAAACPVGVHGQKCNGKGYCAY